MTTDKVLLQKEGMVARIVLNNPARHNALSIDMFSAIERFVDDIAQDREVRLVVISGAGGKAFSAGADISEFERRHASPQAIRENSADYDRVCDKLASLDRPTIAQIEGYCMGGAMVFALSCDLRICSDDSRFGIPPARLGNGYSHGNIERVVQTVGIPFTREILFTGRQFSAMEAYEMGLVNRIVPKAELAAYVENYADTIAGNAPLTVRAVKLMTVELEKDRAQRDVALCDKLFSDCYDSEDYQEGRRAFMEKRRPVFRGK